MLEARSKMPEVRSRSERLEVKFALMDHHKNTSPAFKGLPLDLVKAI